MEYFEVASIPPVDGAPIVLVIGKLDGVHRGHIELLQHAHQYKDGNLAVMSFSEHPQWVLKGDPAYQQSLLPLEHKRTILENLGVTRLYNIQFTQEYAQTSAEEFVYKHLSQLNIKRLVVGEDFRFGKAGKADTDDLINLCEQIGIPVTVIPLVKVDGEAISRTMIRSLIKNGEVEAAQQLLGRPYCVKGHVVHGEALGRTLGFPTINLGGEVDQYVLPKPGIYVGVAEIHDEVKLGEWNVLISAGYRPTVDGDSYLIEAYLLNFSGDLYGKKVTLSFLNFVRDELKFVDLDQLVEQMKLDEHHAREYFRMSGRQ
ncbi:MAG: bifunctional riboflavin kinase/FAD synthetase [Candidatus Pristimantibacillus sp.]